MQISLEKLPIDERLAIVEQVWDSIVADYQNDNVQEIPDSHKKILDERLLAYQNDKNMGENAYDVMAKIRSQFFDNKSS